MDPFARSPSFYARHRLELEAFRNDYVDYTNRVAPSVLAGGPLDHSTERTQLRSRLVQAQHAVSASGVQVALVPPPVAVGHPVLTEFQQVAFAWENPVYQAYGGPQAFELALDAMDAAISELRLREEAVRRRRRSPTYWIDRGLRAMLGFPAYLISLIFGFDRRDVSGETKQLLWLISIAADVGGVFALGRALGWW